MLQTLKEIFITHIRMFSNIVRAGWVDVLKETDGAFFGWFWLIAKPVIYVTMFSFAMGIGLRQAGTGDGEYPYIIWLAAGLIPWFFMSKVFSKGSKVFESYKKLYNIGAYPLVIMPGIAAVSYLFVFLVSFALLIILAIIMGVYPSIYWLQLPVIFLCMYVFYFFFSLFSSCLSTISKDYQKLVGTISMVFFWTSGILFDVSGIDNAFFNAYLTINPFAFIVSGFRAVLTEHGLFFADAAHLLGFAAVVLITVVVSCALFNRLKTVLQDSL
jgi:teichoic acid transport system permease protein